MLNQQLMAPSATHEHSAGLLRALSRLQSWFGTDFLCFDGSSLKLLHSAKSIPLQNRERLLPLVRVIATSGPARCLDGEGAVSLWGLRFESEQRSVIAIAPFLTDLTEPRSEDVCSVLQCDEVDAQKWLSGRSVWPHRGLESFLQVSMQNLLANQRENELRVEIDGLSTNLSHCFEELTLLHDLSRQLRLDTNPEKLGERVLSSLYGCMGARTMAAIWDWNDTTVVVETGIKLGVEELKAARESLTHATRTDPVVRNAPGIYQHWRSRAIGVAIFDNDRPIGMIMALGRSDEQEFGTTEANLLHSVAGVFGGFMANHRLYTEARELFQGAVQALTSAIDAKDPYTCGHSNRVARMSQCLAKTLDLSSEEIETVYLSGLLHDVGKIGIDERVLKKPDRLTDKEFEHIKQHPDLGYRILVNVPAFKPFLPGVRHHHEAWDGSGYPDGLVGDAIPRSAQIIAVADSLDAMTSNRPYRKGMPIDRVEMILREGQGMQWAADVIDAYFTCRDELRTIIQEGNRVMPLPGSDGTAHGAINETIMISRASIASLKS